MSKKWYNYFVTVDPGGDAPGTAPAEGPASNPAGRPTASRTAAQTVAEIAAAVSREPTFKTPVKNPTSFEEIYRAAEIPAPPQGYGVSKVAEMLQSAHIRNLPPEVRRSSVLVALEAAGVKVAEVIEDAVRRDRALDTYERVQQQDVEKLAASKEEENRRIQSELDRLIGEHRARIKANTEEVARVRERFEAWRREKQQEEQRIADTVAHFTSENPISTESPTGASAPAHPAAPPRA